MNKIYGFEGEVRSKLNDTFVELFVEVFCYLPHVLNEKVFIVHGSLFSVDGVKLFDIRAIDRFWELPEEGKLTQAESFVLLINSLHNLNAKIVYKLMYAMLLVEHLNLICRSCYGLMK